MSLITLNGLCGAGSKEIGGLLAQSMGLNYIDRMIMKMTAETIGTDIEVLEKKERSSSSFLNKLNSILSKAFERSAASGIGGDPYVGPGFEALIGKEYPDIHSEVTPQDEVADTIFWNVTREVIETIAAEQSDLVIIGRGSNMMLKETPGSFHIGVSAPIENRIKVVMEREQLNEEDANKYIRQVDNARVHYFRKHFGTTHPNPHDYHAIINTGMMSMQNAATMIESYVLQMGFHK
jgi:cytidylate kinase